MAGPSAEHDLVAARSLMPGSPFLARLAQDCWSRFTSQVGALPSRSDSDGCCGRPLDQSDSRPALSMNVTYCELFLRHFNLGRHSFFKPRSPSTSGIS